MLLHLTARMQWGTARALMSVISRVFRIGLRSYPWRAAISLLMAVACTSLVLVLPTVTQRFIDDVIGQRRYDLLIPTDLLGVGSILFQQILFTLRTYANNALEQRLTHDIRSALYDKLQRLPIKWFDSNSSGEIMSRVADDVPAMDRMIVETIDQTVPAILQFLIIMVWMFTKSWELTLITMAPLPFIAVITTRYSKKAEPRWKESSEAGASLNALLHDNLAGIRQIKAYTVEPEALSRFDVASRNVGEKHMTVMKGQAIIWPVVSLLGAWAVLKGEMLPGTIGAFLIAWGLFFDPIARINPLTQLYVRGSVSAKRVFAIHDLPDESNLTDGERPEKFSGAVRLRNVSFGYTEDSPAVCDLTLEARPGQTVALVGPTGAGKSTVLNLLTRFYEADSGVIELDGTDISKLSKEWLRGNTGFVTQESFLFNTSIRENLLFAKKDASDDELWSALEAANAAAFVKALPEGLDTVAGERGGRFSGGERQRLSIARALLKNPPLLLLDEATSALDNRTERLVQQALDNLRSDRTCFVIAHRLSTVEKADLICVLEKGRIVERGTHDELIALGGLYHRLCEGTSILE
ncbi:MAG: ABC transporter ATP-binding protein [Verrucomicrobiales bacterium VVV1]|nr:MAG: ABC transporter ATP-binding protein [Verrucomicrobiales bacterium VVV1]